jgi:hypothetical protein
MTKNHDRNGRHVSLSHFETGVISPTVIWKQDEWGDMRVGYETYVSDFDDAELLKVFPVTCVRVLTGAFCSQGG